MNCDIVTTCQPHLWTPETRDTWHLQLYDCNVCIDTCPAQPCQLPPSLTRPNFHPDSRRVLTRLDPKYRPAWPSDINFEQSRTCKQYETITSWQWRTADHNKTWDTCLLCHEGRVTRTASWSVSSIMGGGVGANSGRWRVFCLPSSLWSEPVAKFRDMWWWNYPRVVTTTGHGHIAHYRHSLAARVCRKWAYGQHSPMSMTPD